MYARSLVDARIETAERELGFSLEHHSVSDIEDFNSRLEERYASAYAAARKASQAQREPEGPFQAAILRELADPENPRLSSDEIRFIQNERALSICDSRYWLERYYWVKSQDRGIVRYVPRAAQEIFMNVVAELQTLKAPVEIINAKARQHGISTQVSGMILHGTAYASAVNSVAASADDDMTERMAQMYFGAWDLVPWWNRPGYTRRVESKAGGFGFGSIKSQINFQHGAQSSGMGRGDTIRLYHLSEVSSYTNAAEQIEAALFKCVHPHPGVLGVLESTAAGNTGWFYDTYRYSKRGWGAGHHSRLYALFLPWFIGSDIYPNPTWLRIHPVPDGWKPQPETHRMIAKAETFIRKEPMLSRVIGLNWKMPRHQAWYWEANFLEQRAKGLEKIWYQEMPTDDDECFQSSYDNVFGREIIAEADSRRESRYHVFGIVGQSIEERYEPEEGEFDHSVSPISVAFHNRIKDLSYRWDLQPLLWEEPFRAIEDIRSSDDHHMGKLFVYREPERGFDYSMGVRTGDGLGARETVVAVARRGRDQQEPDVQVAEFRSNVVSHVEAYAVTMAIAAYYGKFMGMDGMSKNQPYVAIESMQTVGDHCYLQMQKMGYRRFHKMTRYDTDPRNMNARKAGGGRVGWFSTGWSTPMYTGTFVVWVRNGWYQVNSPYTIWEMDHWEQHLTEAGKTKYLSPEESSDAGVLANAMAAFCVNDMRSMAERTMKRCYGPRGAKAKLDLTPTGSGIAFPTSGRYNSYNESKLLGRHQY